MYFGYVERTCFNCNTNLNEKAHYCSNCGQQVDDNNLSLRAVGKSFFENYISLDTRFVRTLKPFLFKPGYLTLRFIEGIRKNYANPFRLYIITSIVFFSLMSYHFLSLNQLSDQQNILNGIKENTELQVFGDIDSTEWAQLNQELSQSVIKQLNELDSSSFIAAFDQLSSLKKKRVARDLDDDLQKAIGLAKDSSIFDTEAGLNFTSESQGFQYDVFDMDWEKIKLYRYDKRYSDAMLLDSMSLEPTSKLNHLMLMQSLRVYRSDRDTVSKYVLKNMSFVMFLLVPLFALLLKLFYYKSRLKYVGHLIHSIHIHSFSFFLLSVWMGFSLLNISPEIANTLQIIVIIWMFIHFIKSIKVVYKRSWIGVLAKTLLLGFMYSILLGTFIVLEMMVSFLMY